MTEESIPTYECNFEVINGIKYMLAECFRNGRIPCYTSKDFEKGIKFFEGDSYYDEDENKIKIFLLGKIRSLRKDA